jgi:hypothetical protein
MDHGKVVDMGSYYTLQLLYTALTMHCTHYTLYSLYTVLTMHCTQGGGYEQLP